MAGKESWQWITNVDELDRFVESLTEEEWARIGRKIQEGMDINSLQLIKTHHITRHYLILTSKQVSYLSKAKCLS